MGEINSKTSIIMKNEPQQNPHDFDPMTQTSVRGSMIVTLKSGEKFIEPDILELVPEIYKYCGPGEKFNNGEHCNALYKLLFKNANHASNNPHFASMTKDVTDDSKVLVHHVSRIMGKCQRTDVLQMCDDFKSISDEFLNNTHPLSKKLADTDSK